MRERQRHRQREKQAPYREHEVGLDPWTPGSRPGPKAGAKPLSHPGTPWIWFFKEFLFSTISKKIQKIQKKSKDFSGSLRFPVHLLPLHRHSLPFIIFPMTNFTMKHITQSLQYLEFPLAVVLSNGVNTCIKHVPNTYYHTEQDHSTIHTLCSIHPSASLKTRQPQS